jgi:hypothetical protein
MGGAMTLRGNQLNRECTSSSWVDGQRLAGNVNDCTVPPSIDPSLIPQIA